MIKEGFPALKELFPLSRSASGGASTCFDEFLVFFGRHTIGDSKVPFCMQSCVKPLKYAIAVNDHGTEYVHSFIGKEPSGLRFNKLFLNEEGEPPRFFAHSVSQHTKTSEEKKDSLAANEGRHVVQKELEFFFMDSGCKNARSLSD